MRKLALTISLVLAASVNPASGEVAGEMYPSPDKARELRVVRTSEGPDLTARLLQDHKVVWSQNLGANPGDKVVVWWCPDSSAVLIEHINSEKQCRLFVVEIGKERVQAFTVSPHDLRDVSSVQADKVVWEGDGSITLGLETKTGSERRRIVWSCHLVPVETGK